MSLSVITFKAILVAICLSAQMTVARNMSYPGILDAMPKNCSRAYFCLEQHENYPQELIDELLTNTLNLSLGSPDENNGPYTRKGEEVDEADCKRTITYGQIYEIEDENNDTRVVVQSELFKQQIRIEQCDKPGPLTGKTVHFSIDKGEQDNNNLECVNEKMDYHFLVLTKDGKGVESVTSKYGIPVCCSCRNNV